MLTVWNYEESVRRVSEKVREWKAVSLKKSTLTNEIARELYEAREQLDARGRNLPNVPNGTYEKGWREYLEEVGLSKSTVHRWLEYYEPNEQRLLTDDEYEQRKREEQRKKMDHEQAIKDKVQDRIQHNSIPSDWNDEAEQAYQEKLRQEQKNKEWRERIKQESEMREKAPSKTDEALKDFEELLSDLNVQAENRKKITEKMRLTGDNAYHEFNQMLIDYLESLDSDSQRLEACYNGIKIFKAYIRDHNLVRA